MSGKDQLISFIQLAFLLAIGTFVLFYFILGNRMDLARQIVIAVAAFSVIVVFFTIIKNLDSKELKEKIMNVIENIFLVILSIFCFYFFIIGNRMDLADKVVRFMMVFAVFGFVFLIKAKLATRFVIKQKRDGIDLNEIIVYLEDADRVKDWIVVLLLPLVIIISTIFSLKITKLDVFQAIVVFVLIFLLHKILFKKGMAKVEFLTIFDRVKDEMMTYFLPVSVLLIAYFGGSANFIDIVQAILVYGIAYAWHKILFRPN